MKKMLVSVFCICAGFNQSVWAADIIIWGNQDAADQGAVVNFLQGSGHNVTDNGSTTPSAGQLAANDIAILLRGSGNADVSNWVRGGGCLITEWTGADWALNSANLIDASVSGGGLVGTDTPVTITADGIAAGLADSIPNPYSAGVASEFFRDFTGIGAGVSIMATRPGDGDEAAVLGGAFSSGLVLANGIDWADGQFSGDDNRQFLLNSIEGFCGGARFVPQPVPGLSAIGLILLAGLTGLIAAFGFKRRHQSTA
ncbi:MAG: hypothetical protein HKN15_04325 [Xanthomonadales bacterium]|nr:hypothetical protein [Xanthomonadales bacterium]